MRKTEIFKSYIRIDIVDHSGRAGEDIRLLAGNVAERVRMRENKGDTTC